MPSHPFLRSIYIERDRDTWAVMHHIIQYHYGDNSMHVCMMYAGMYVCIRSPLVLPRQHFWKVFCIVAMYDGRGRVQTFQNVCIRPYTYTCTCTSSHTGVCSRAYGRGPRTIECVLLREVCTRTHWQGGTFEGHILIEFGINVPLDKLLKRLFQILGDRTGSAKDRLFTFFFLFCFGCAEVIRRRSAKDRIR